VFAIEVEYLTGRAVATTRHRREEAEWPPHPGRLFSALVDAAFQADSTDGLTLPDDIRAALEWLERLDPPSVAVSGAQRRDVIPVFVPVNDAVAPEVKAGKVPSAGQIADAVAVLPDGRGKQARFFPTVIPDSPLVHFVWDSAPDAEKHRPALDRLATNVTYLGHSSSLVRVEVIDAHAPITHRPDPNGRHTLRVPARGRLAELVSHDRRNARPSPGLYAAYAKVSEEKKPVGPAESGSVFGDVIVCEIDGPFLPLSGATRFLNAVRDAVIRATDTESQAVKTLVSGHTADGGVSREDHVAYIPLANVGFNRYSDGKVMGFGLVLPRGLARFSAERRAILKAVAGLDGIGFGGHEWRVTIPTENIPKSLETWAYTAASKLWATVTPILCDRFPKEKDGERLEDILAQSVERVVGVRPVHVHLTRTEKHPFRIRTEMSDERSLKVGAFSVFHGVPPSHEFSNRRKPDDPPRHRIHAVVEFDREVRGPLIVGAGRYQGLGLFRVWKPEGRE
jgi:CRISPR-associated protein Csb2